jgi:hypothetical protein
MNFNKIKLFCGKFRIMIGIALIITGFFIKDESVFYNIWFGLGLLPLIAGITNFCPLCIITKKCNI